MSLLYKLKRQREKFEARARMRQLAKNPPPMPKLDGSEGPVRLHIGCGDIHIPGFVNIDARAMPHVHIVTEDLFTLAQFPNASVDFIYMSHLLEHVRRHDQTKVLAEMARVLKPGGILRLGVPDFDLLVKMYQATGNNTEAIEGILLGGQDYDYNYHFMIYNKDSLTRALKHAGFASVRPWDPTNDPLHPLPDQCDRLAQWGGKTYPFSLNLEGVR